MMAVIHFLLATIPASAAAPAVLRGESPVAGPARVCLVHTSIDLEAGETASLDYQGIHSEGMRVSGPNGTLHVREGTWTQPHGGRRVQDLLGRTVERHRREGQVRYLIYRRSSEAPNDDHPSVWVEGNALGRSRDVNVLARINVDQNDPASCQRRFE